MRRFFFDKGKLYNDKLNVQAEEYNHIVNVLRQKENDIIVGFCNDEFDYYFIIESIKKKQIELCLKDVVKNTANPTRKIVLFQGLPKGTKLDTIIQKATELGASSIIPFESEFSVARPNENKLTRMQRISIEACKQCGRSRIVEIKQVVKFNEMIKMLSSFDQIIFAYEKAEVPLFRSIKKSNNIALIVGSEGGFSDGESKLVLDNNANMVSLGNRILRTETAGLAMLAALSFWLEA